MSRLTWQNVSAPSFAGVQDSYNAATRLLGQATAGASNALGTFGDQGVLSALAKYKDASALQRNLETGAFNIGNASAEALGKVMSRPSHLIENAVNQQNYDYRQQANPLTLESTRLANEHARLGNPIARDLQRVRLASDVDAYTQNVTGRDAGYQAAELIRQATSQGAMDSPEGLQAVWNQAQNHPDPRVRQAVWNQLQQVNPAQFSPQLGPSGSMPVASTAAGTSGGSVGERNNNQGNLVGTGWVTQMPGYMGNDSRGFAIFQSAEQGNAANLRQLERYWEGTQATGGKPVRTINEIIDTWAPVGSGIRGNTSEQNANYKKYVADQTGIDVSKEISKEDLPKVLTAMQQFETGNTAAAQARNLMDSGRAVERAGNIATAATTTADMLQSNPDVQQMLNAFATGRDKSQATVVAELKAKFPSMNDGNIARILANTQQKMGGVAPAVAGALIENTGGDTSLLGGFLGFSPEFGIDEEALNAKIEGLKGDDKTFGGYKTFNAFLDSQVQQLNARQTREDISATVKAYQDEAARLSLLAQSMPEGERKRQLMARQEQLRSLAEAAANQAIGVGASGIPPVPQQEPERQANIPSTGSSSQSQSRAEELLSQATEPSLVEVARTVTADSIQNMNKQQLLAIYNNGRVMANVPLPLHHQILKRISEL